MHKLLTSASFDCCSPDIHELLANEEKNNYEEVVTIGDENTETTNRPAMESRSFTKNGGSSQRIKYWIMLLCLVFIK